MNEEFVDRQQRAARNQSMWREINERVREVRGASTSTYERFLCECEKEDCVEEVSLRVAEYEAIRSHPDRFAVVPGHVDLEVERVVDRDPRFEVVEKVAEAGRVAIQLDPRGSATA